ncbi:heavy-metal-associated domain-containing protein [Zhongshania sp.]|uniref:heavy-metal-associated domain-containing protein n=1 Tax=Zhongshania sp. TaxID=1971902 RepID=UPI0035648B3E
MSASKANTPSVFQDIETLQLAILGMNCGACVGRITRALNELDGIQLVDINLGNKSAKIQFSPAEIDIESITAAIAEAGYQSSAIDQPSDLLV